MAASRRRWRTEGLNLGLEFRDTLPIDFPPPVPDDLREPTDSVVFRGSPPRADGSEAVRDFPTLNELRIEEADPKSGGRRRSLSWFGSIALHAALVILVAILLAPADFGGLTSQTLFISLEDEMIDAPVPIMLIDTESSDDSSLLSEAEPQPDPVEPVEVSLDLGTPAFKIGGLQKKPGKSSGKTKGGSSGSFFGIEAVGQDFVYIVDRSGSMNGRRYRRAISELKRSVRELREDQRFLVVLFSSSPRTMFGRSLSSAEMLNATEKNKERLEDWLVSVSAGGGTNPESSLRMAMRIKPSAVFMLSDGEFNETKSKKRGGLLTAGGDAHSIVATSGKSIPVHAIAFEDPRSCENMKQLAEISGGEYRFINSAGKTQSQLIAEAKALVDKPNSKGRSLEQAKLVRDFGSSQVSSNAKRLFANLLLEEHDAKAFSLSAPSIEETEALVELLVSLVLIDPRRAACGEIQDDVAGQLSRCLNGYEDPELQLQARELACDRLVRLPRSASAENALDRLTDHFSELDDGDPNKAFERLYFVRSMHPGAKAVAICQATCDEISKELLHESEKAIAEGNISSAIQSLRKSQSECSNSTLRALVTKSLKQLTFDQLVALRDARQARDIERRNEIDRALEKGFQRDAQLSQWRKELFERERHANRLLGNANDTRTHNSVDAQQRQLQAVVEHYPETIAARKATGFLKRLPQVRAEKNEEEMELIRMMTDTPRR